MIVKVVTNRTTQRPPSSLHDLNCDNDIISYGQSLALRGKKFIIRGSNYYVLLTEDSLILAYRNEILNCGLVIMK